MKKTFTVVYPHAMRPGRYDGAHFICYLNESSADYKADEDATPVPGFAYTGPAYWSKSVHKNGVMD